MKPLRVRAYNIEFGDATLVSIPENDNNGNEIYRHILIDVGNRGTEDDNRLFDEVIADILSELNDRPLDLYIMTHEHLDHVQGIPYADKYHYGTKDDTQLLEDLDTKFSWFPISSKQGYYQDPSRSLAKERFSQMNQTLKEIESFTKTLKAINVPLTTHLETLLSINIGWTKDCVDHLQKFREPRFVHRCFDTSDCPTFTDTKIEIWAPEEDIGVYLSDFSPKPMKLGNPEKPLVPPHGVDAGIFYDLVGTRERLYENLLAANSSINNTSIVFCIEWKGNRLLFTGDAEESSWKTMDEQNVLKEVDFLKVSHHGSHNGTPDADILEKILPSGNPDGRHALLSTAIGPYDSIPDADTLASIEERCEKLHQLHLEVDPGKYKDIEFKPK